MKTVPYHLSNPRSFYNQLKESLPSKIEKNSLVFNPEIGKGYFKYYEVFEGLWAQKFDFKLKEKIELRRKATQKNEYFVIDFLLTSSVLKREFEGNKIELSCDSVNMLLTSSASEAQLSIPQNKAIKVFNVLFTREWINQNVLIDHPNSYDFFQSDKPIYIAENLDYKIKDLIHKISFEDNKISTISKVLELINYIFERVKKRTEIANSNSNIHPDDLEQMMRIREYLDTNLDGDFTNESLAYMVSMSLSKFKRLFKQIFDTTPYQYHLANKMEKAMDSLQQGNHSVSDIGYLIGYSNLSQFSKAFKKHFGILPSEVLA